MGAMKATSTDSASDDSAHMGEQRAVTWAHPKRNLWVASHSGQRAGSVELIAEHFVSCDAGGQHRITHPDLRLAQHAVECGWSLHAD